MKTFYSSIVFCLLMILVSPLLLADVIHLKNGGKIDGKVVDSDGKAYVVQMKIGRMTTLVNKDEVERVESVKEEASRKLLK